MLSPKDELLEEVACEEEEEEEEDVEEAEYSDGEEIVDGDEGEDANEGENGENEEGGEADSAEVPKENADQNGFVDNRQLGLVAPDKAAREPKKKSKSKPKKKPPSSSSPTPVEKKSPTPSTRHGRQLARKGDSPGSNLNEFGGDLALHGLEETGRTNRKVVYSARWSTDSRQNFDNLDPFAWSPTISPRSVRPKLEPPHEEPIADAEHLASVLHGLTEQDLVDLGNRYSWRSVPRLVEEVLVNVHCILDLDVECWEEAKANLRLGSGLLLALRSFNIDLLELKHLQVLRRRMTKCPGAFSREHVSAISEVCGVLCEWVNRACYEATTKSWLHKDAVILECLSHHDITELSTFNNPPMLIEAVLINIHLVLGLEPTWVAVRHKTRGGKEFLERLRYFNQQSISTEALRALHYSFKKLPQSFAPELVSAISETCAVLCEWLNAVCQRAGVRLPDSPQVREGYHNFLRESRTKYAKERRIRERQLRRQAAQKRQMIEDGWSFRPRSPPAQPKPPSLEPAKFLSAATLKRMASRTPRKPSSPLAASQPLRDFIAGPDVDAIGLVAIDSPASPRGGGAAGQKIVGELAEGKWAKSAGICENDVIVMVNGLAADDIPLPLIRGAMRKRPLRLTIRPAEQSKIENSTKKGGLHLRDESAEANPDDSNSDASPRANSSGLEKKPMGVATNDTSDSDKESPKQEIQKDIASADASKTAKTTDVETNAGVRGVNNAVAAPVKNAGNQADAKGAASGQNLTASINKSTPTSAKAESGGGTVAESAETANGEQPLSNAASPSPTVQVKDSPSPSDQSPPPPASTAPARPSPATSDGQKTNKTFISWKKN